MTTEQKLEMDNACEMYRQHIEPFQGKLLNRVALAMYFEIGWCMHAGIPLREIPVWKDQPGIQRVERQVERQVEVEGELRTCAYE